MIKVLLLSLLISVSYCQQNQGPFQQTSFLSEYLTDFLNNLIQISEKLRSNLANFQTQINHPILKTIATKPNQILSNNALSGSASYGCSTSGSNKVCNVMADNISGGTFVGKRSVGFVRVKRQYNANTVNVNSPTVSGGNFVGKRNIGSERVKRQYIGNTANVYTNLVSEGNFIGKRNVGTDIVKRQYIGNTANVHANVISSGNFIGKRNFGSGIAKRQYNGNTANVLTNTVFGGHFEGKRNLLDDSSKSLNDKKKLQREKRNIANLMANHIQGATFSGQANVMDSSVKGMSTKCDSTGCVNIMG